MTLCIESMQRKWRNLLLGGVCIVFLVLIGWGIKKVGQNLIKDNPKHRKPGSIVRIDDNMYKIEKELGSGCCGIVYKAVPHTSSKKTPESIPQPLAIKIIHKPGKVDCETRMLQTVPDHPNVIHIHKLGHAKSGEPSIVMEYIPDSLHSLDSTILHDPHRIRTIMYQLLQAVKHLHEHDVVHRDIKPSNILYRKPSSEAVLTDFGHARYTVDGRLRRGYAYARGTHSYFAPEGLKKEEHQDRSLDLWSLGCIFGKLVCKHTLFKDHDDVDDIVRDQTEFVKTQKWNEWNEWNERFPKSKKLAKDLLQSMLQIDPKMRPSAEECLEHEWFHTEQFP